MNRFAPDPSPSEGLAYVFLAILAALVIAHASQTPHDPVSPDGRLIEASR